MRAARAARCQSHDEGNVMRNVMYGEQPSVPSTAGAASRAVRHLSSVESSQLPRTARSSGRGAPPRTSGGRSTEVGSTVHPEYDPTQSVMQQLIYGGGMGSTMQRRPAKPPSKEDYETPLARRGPRQKAPSYTVAPPVETLLENDDEGVDDDEGRGQQLEQHNQLQLLSPQRPGMPGQGMHGGFGADRSQFQSQPGPSGLVRTTGGDGGSGRLPLGPALRPWPEDEALAASIGEQTPSGYAPQASSRWQPPPPSSQPPVAQPSWHQQQQQGQQQQLQLIDTLRSQVSALTSILQMGVHVPEAGLHVWFNTNGNDGQRPSGWQWERLNPNPPQPPAHVNNAWQPGQPRGPPSLPQRQPGQPIQQRMFRAPAPGGFMRQ